MLGSACSRPCRSNCGNAGSKSISGKK
jgi:hypothetical protein